MKKVLQKALLGIALVLSLSLILITSYANNEAGSGTPGGSMLPIIDSGGGTVGGKQHGGPSSAKSGFFVTVSVADSPQGTPHAVGHGAVLRSKDAERYGYNVPSFDVAGQSKIPGASMGAYGTAPWDFPAYGEGTGYGKLVIGWSNTPNAAGTGDNGITIMEEYCGVTKEQVLQWQAENKAIFLNVEPIAWSQ